MKPLISVLLLSLLLVANTNCTASDTNESPEFVELGLLLSNFDDYHEKYISTRGIVASYLEGKVLAESVTLKDSSAHLSAPRIWLDSAEVSSESECFTDGEGGEVGEFCYATVEGYFQTWNSFGPGYFYQIGHSKKPAPPIDYSPIVISTKPISGSWIQVGKNAEETEYYYDGPGLAFINFIQSDDAGNVWIATDGRGLTMFDGLEWKNWDVETNPEMKDDCFRSMQITDDKVYLAARSSSGSGGVMIYDIDRQAWTNLWPHNSGLSAGGVGGVAVNNQGKMYFPTYNGVLDIYDNGQWEHIDMAPKREGTGVTICDSFFDSRGNYWLCGNNTEVWKYDGLKWTVHGTVLLGETGIQNRAMVMDRSGQIWVAHGDYLAVRSSDGYWQIYGDIPCWDLSIDNKGRLWAVSTEVVLVHDGQSWQAFTPEEAGIEKWGDTIGFDGKGRPWISVLPEGAVIFDEN